MGGAPIGAGGHDPPLLEARGTQFGDNSYLTYCSYHVCTLMSTFFQCCPPMHSQFRNLQWHQSYEYELGWLSYLSNIPPTGQKVGVKNLSPHFQNRSTAHVCLFVDTVTSEWVNIGWWNLECRCIVQKSRPCSNLGIIAPWVRSPQKCGVRLRRWKNQHRLSSFEVILNYFSVSFHM